MKIDTVNSSGMMQNLENKISEEISKVTKDEVTSLDDINRSQLKDAIDILNKKAKETNYNVQFAVYKDTNRIIVQVVDKITKEVISTFPPKQILEMARMVEQEFKILDKKI